MTATNPDATISVRSEPRAGRHATGHGGTLRDACATLCGMTRVRISTTVDAERLRTCRRLLAVPDSKLIDRALALLIEEIEGRRELAVLEAQPYESDPELSWVVPAGPDLPYDGDVPADVLRLAESRRQRR